MTIRKHNTWQHNLPDIAKSLSWNTISKVLTLFEQNMYFECLKLPWWVIAMKFSQAFSHVTHWSPKKTSLETYNINPTKIQSKLSLLTISSYTKIIISCLTHNNIQKQRISVSSLMFYPQYTLQSVRYSPPFVVRIWMCHFTSCNLACHF